MTQIKENIKNISYYSILGKYGFVIIIKETDRGWYWWDIWEHFTSPHYYGKSRPRLSNDEKPYIMSKDFNTVLPQIESMMNEWKMRVLEDHRLNYSARNYLEDIYYRNKARCIQYYIPDDNSVITLETRYAFNIQDGGEWTQVLGLIGDRDRRTFLRESSGDTIIHPRIPQVTQEDARSKANDILDSQIAEYIQSIKMFCGVIE